MLYILTNVILYLLYHGSGLGARETRADDQVTGTRDTHARVRAHAVSILVASFVILYYIVLSRVPSYVRHCYYIFAV